MTHTTQFKTENCTGVSSRGKNHTFKQKEKLDSLNNKLHIWLMVVKSAFLLGK